MEDAQVDSRDGVALARNARGVATITLDRPAVRNAFDEKVIARLAGIAGTLRGDARVRAVVLRGSGKVFCAGADLAWMRRAAGFDEARNLEDARDLGRMLAALDRLPQPTIALIHGAALGGATGLVAACDIAVASREAVFATSEVRLGLIPSVISPYVVRAIGARQARRWFLTGERFGADEALRIGLVHRVVATPGELDAARDELLGALGACAPGAVAAAKELVRAVRGRPIDDDVLEDTARRIAERRATEEGREGAAAFLEKRRPAWSGEERR